MKPLLYARRRRQSNTVVSCVVATTGVTVTLTLSTIPLTTGAGNPADRFTLKNGAASLTKSASQIVGKTIVVTVAETIAAGDPITHAYDSTASGQGIVGLATYTDTAATNNSTQTRNTQSVVLDGVDDYMDFGTSANLKPEVGAYTLAFWMKTPAALASNANMMIFATSEVDGKGMFCCLNRGAGGDLTSNNLDLGHAGIADRCVAYTWASSTWYHVAAVQSYSGSPGSWELYVNGVSVGTRANAAGYNSAAGQVSRIASPYGDMVPFKGSLKDFRVITVAVSAANIALLATVTSIGKRPSQIVGFDTGNCPDTSCHLHNFEPPLTNAQLTAPTTNAILDTGAATAVNGTGANFTGTPLSSDVPT